MSTIEALALCHFLPSQVFAAVEQRQSAHSTSEAHWHSQRLPAKLLW